MIGRRAEIILNRAVRYAVEQEHEYFTLEHVFWSLLSDEQIQSIVTNCGGNFSNMRLELEQYLDVEISKTKRDPASTGEEGPEDHPVATLSIQRLIQRALFHVQSSGKEEITPEDLFVALFQAKNSKALLLLIQQGIERIDVLNYISHGIIRDSNESKENGEESENLFSVSSNESSDTIEEKAAPRKKISDDALALYSTDLNQKAREGKIDPVIGREQETQRIIQTLCRRQKNNPLLIGEAGVGKTALVEGLAKRIEEEKVPKLIQNSLIFSLDLTALLAGAKFRGDFEQRFKKVIQSLNSKVEAGITPILFIDEIHTVMGAGSVSGGAMDAANLLKPLLSSSGIRCIGSTTFTDFRNTIEKDNALTRRFQKIEINEPSQDEAVKILMGLKPKFEEHHRVKYTLEAIKASVELSCRHLSDRFLPDKAIDVIDEAGAKRNLETSGDQEGETQSPPELGAHAIEEVIAQLARIPSRSVSTSQKRRLQNLEDSLRLSIFGQDNAISALVTAIRLSRSGLKSGNRPVGSFLFCGPTGVGKTEISKQLAHCLGIPFLRYDMSEYSEKHTVSRLIGAPPGYVGFDQAGLLTEAVQKSPYSVILLDEIEKAHPEVWNILLQVMDHGTLTDSNGKKADFKNAVIILTSNVGSREMERNPLGMGDSSNGSITHTRAKKAVEETFSPEFRNRLDSIVFFNPLSRDSILRVVSKHLVELESQLLEKNVEITVDTQVREWLAEKGYDRQLGARPLNRVIQDQIKRPLSEEILFGKLENGGKVRVSLIKPDTGEAKPEFIYGSPEAPLFAKSPQFSTPENFSGISH